MCICFSTKEIPCCLKCIETDSKPEIRNIFIVHAAITNECLHIVYTGVSIFFTTFCNSLLFIFCFHSFLLMLKCIQISILWRKQECEGTETGRQKTEDRRNFNNNNNYNALQICTFFLRIAIFLCDAVHCTQCTLSLCTLYTQNVYK